MGSDCLSIFFPFSLDASICAALTLRSAAMQGRAGSKAVRKDIWKSEILFKCILAHYD